MSSERYVLYGRPGSGSAVIEAALVMAGVPYVLETVEVSTRHWPERLRQLNPIRQVPILFCPDGNALTESGAMILHIDDCYTGAGLVPPKSDGIRPAFWRWLFFFTSSLYPSFTYSDVPDRFVTGESAIDELCRNVNSWRKQLWEIAESQCGRPHFFGKSLTAVDLYIWVMSHWHPGRSWLEDRCPCMCDVADAVDSLEVLDNVRKWNFKSTVQSSDER